MKIRAANEAASENAFAFDASLNENNSGGAGLLAVEAGLQEAHNLLS